VAAVGSPTGAFVAAGIASDFDGLTRDDVHNVDVVVTTGPAPTEGKQLSIGRPSGIDDVTHVWQIKFLGVGAVGVHEIELRNATAIADIGDGLTGLWIPCGGGVGSVGGGEGDALGAIAAGIADVKVRGALHGRREHNLRAVGRPGGRTIGALVAREGNNFVGVEGVHADLCGSGAASLLETGEGDARIIGRPARRERNGFQRSERMLVGAVVIHNPKFLGASARTDEGNLRGGNAGQAAGKLADDFVGELMSKFANLGVSRRAAIDLANDGLGAGAANIKHPGGDGDFGGGFRKIAEGDVVGVHGRIGPGEIAEFAGLRRKIGGGIKTGADEFDDAAEGEIVANDGGEEGGVIGGVIGLGNKSGNGDARLVDAEAGAGTKPWLGFLAGCGKSDENKKRKERRKRNAVLFHGQECLRSGTGWTIKNRG